MFMYIYIWRKREREGDGEREREGEREGVGGDINYKTIESFRCADPCVFVHAMQSLRNLSRYIMPHDAVYQLYKIIS